MAQVAPFTHAGHTGSVVRLSVVNLLLNIITLSLWRFWGKTRVRRALWAGTIAWGDPAEYTGTGRELFLGFLVAMVAVFMPIAIAIGAAQAAVEAGNPAAGAIVVLLQLLIAVLAAGGLYRARRYQLSRTVWRAIRGGQGGSALRYGLMFLGVALLTVLSLGWALPWAEMGLARYRMDNTTFGDCRFSCDARAKPLYGRFAVVWVCGAVFGSGLAALVGAAGSVVQSSAEPLLPIAGAVLTGLAWALVTLALPLAWYRAGFLRQLAAHTRFDGHAFALEARTDALIRLAIGNWLIATLSLGILRPWAALRTFRFACAALRLEDEPDWERVHQGAVARSRTGEGLAAVFDGAGEF